MGGVAEQLKESGGALASVWHNRGLRRLSLAFVGSMVGDWAFVTGVAVYVYQHSGPGTDRYDRRTIMPNLANSPSELTAANVVSSTIHSVGFLAGPAVAGLLLALSGVGAVYVFNAASFAWSALLALGLHAQRPAPSDAADDAGEAANETWLQEAAAGFSTILRHRDLRRIMSLYVAQTIVAGCANVFEVVVAIRLLHTKPAGVGLLGSATGVGGLLGGVVALLLARRGTVARNFGVGVAMWAAPLLLIAVWPNMAVTLAAMALVGIGNSLVDVNFETIVQRLAPDTVLGRVFGAMDSAAVAGMSVGAALMPLLIDQLGIRRALIVVGTLIEQGTAIVLAQGSPLASIGAGDSLGEVALLRNVPRTATIRASTDLTLRAIDRRHFIPAVTGHAAASEQAELVVGRFLGTA
jgi:predicted MFS family arabinose efflux permease